MRGLLAAIATLAGCGLDVVGTAAPGPADAAADGKASSPPRDDAAADAETSADAGDSGAGDSGPTKEPLCPPSADLLGCFAWEGSATDESPRRLILEQATNLRFEPGREGLAARFTLSPKSDVRLPYAGFNTPLITIEAWIRAASLPSPTRTLVVDMDLRIGLRIMADGTFSCTSIAAATKVTVGTWMHVACVHDGTKTTTYVNGVAEASGVETLGQTTSWVGIGQNSPGADDGFDGLIDNVRIWSSARTAAEIAAAAAR